MKNRRSLVRASLMSGLLLTSGLALAAPSFAFVTDAKLNLMMMGETIDLVAYPKLPLLFRQAGGSNATLVFRGADAAGAYAFYDSALKSEGWADAPMGGAMVMDAMAKDSMAKDTMTKDTMAKDTMAKDTMAKDTMAKDSMASGDAMMSMEGMKRSDGSYQGRYTMNQLNLGLTSLARDGKVYVYLSVR